MGVVVVRGPTTGKGETVRQERTSARGDPGGSANPTWSKVKTWEGGPPNPQVDRIDGWPPIRVRQGPDDRIPLTG
jgi:hypothetical protein